MFKCSTNKGIWSSKIAKQGVFLFWFGFLSLLVENDIGEDELSDQGYTSLPKSEEIESGQMVLK